MTFEEIDKLIDSLISESISVGSTMRNDSNHVSYKNIDLGKETLYDAIMQYGCASAAEGFELGEIAASKMSEEELSKEIKRIEDSKQYKEQK